LHDWFYRDKKCNNGPHHNKPQLTKEQTAKLDELGVDWTVATVAQQAGKYSKPLTWDERYEQIDKLDELGIDWFGNQVSTSGTGHSRWDDKFEQLKAFKMEYGHTEIPPNGDWISLYHWLYNNRRRKISPYQYSPQLTTEQIDKLDELGIDWECKNTYDKSRSIRSALPS